MCFVQDLTTRLGRTCCSLLKPYSLCGVGLTGLVDRGITPHPSFYHNPAFAPWPHNLDLRQVGYWMVRGWRIGHFLGKYISPWSFVRIAIGDRSWILKVKTEIKRQQTIEITPAREVIHLMFVE